MGCPKLQWFFTVFRHSHPFSMVTFFPPGPAAMQRRLWDLSQTPARRRTTISAIIGLNLGHIRHAKHAMEEPASSDPALSKCDPLSFSPRHPPAHYEARPLSFQALKTTSPGLPLHWSSPATSVMKPMRSWRYDGQTHGRNWQVDKYLMNINYIILVTVGCLIGIDRSRNR